MLPSEFDHELYVRMKVVNDGGQKPLDVRGFAKLVRVHFTNGLVTVQDQIYFTDDKNNNALDTIGNMFQGWS